MSIKNFGKQWLEAGQIIAEAIKEINPGQPEEQYHRCAAAIIARLACLNPPILLAYPDELKEEMYGKGD